jgi:hypothetical protein
MVCVLNYITCQSEFCKARPCFNFENETTGIYCSKHKLQGMIDVKNKRCEYEGCKINACYNFKGINKRRFCLEHKIEGMINIASKMCISKSICENYGNKKYDDYCSFCFHHLFPNDERTKQMRIKSKELIVKDFLEEQFEGFVHDQSLYTHNCDCSHRRRIDFRKLINNTLLCIEVDEFQHKRYNKEDEDIRYNDVFMLHGGKFIFIRFNPDKYTNKNNETISSHISHRLPKLKKEIDKQIKRIEDY